MPFNTKWILGGLILLVALFVVGYVYFGPVQNQSSTAIEAGKIEFEKGNDTEAIASLKKAVSLADGDKYIEGRAKLTLGIYVTATQDPVEGVNILKEVVNNEDYNPATRARAIDALEDHMQGSHDTSFAKLHIFTGDPFASFLVNDDFELSAKKLYEYSNTIYPTAKAELRIAEWYGGQLTERVPLSPSIVTEYTDIIRQKIDSANNLFPPPTTEVAFLTGYLYMLRAGQEKILSEFGKGDFSQAESDYKQALKITKTQPDNINLQDLDLFVRFHYAASIEDVYGPSRSNDISELLKEFNSVPIKNRYFDKFLANEATSNNQGIHTHAEHHHYQDIIDLAKISPEFKAKAESVGWIFN